MPVNPGRLKQRITILRADRIHGPGGYEDTWLEDRAVWANINQPTPNGAARYAQAGYSFVTHEIVLRTGPELDLSKTRFQLGARTFEPIAPPRDSGRFITIGCRELNHGET